jgi:hypothetical protein
MSKNHMKLALTLLMLAAFIIPPGALGAQTTTPKGPTTPDPPEDAPRFNYTDINRVQHTVPQGVPQVLRMGASTMEFRATQRLQLNISQAPGLTATYFAMNMVANRNMHVNMLAGNEPPVDTAEAAFGLRRYFTLENNGTEPFRATLRLYIDDAGLADELGRPILKERLTWCYWNGTGWMNVPSHMDDQGFLEAETSHFSAWTVAENKKPNEVPTPEIPGVPEKTRTYNYSDEVPEGFSWTLSESEEACFTFKNMAMVFNSADRVQLRISAESEVRQRLFRLDVEPRKAVELEVRFRESKPESVEPARNHIGFYLEIEPNATEPVKAKLGVLIEPAAIREQIGLDVDPLHLAWCYYDGWKWVEVPSTLDEDGVLVAETGQLSHVWTVQETRLNRETQRPEIPGVPETTRAFNYTDRVPEAFRWTLRERESNTLQFRDTAMVFSSTKKVQLRITAQEEFRQRLFRLELEPSEALELQIRLQAEKPSDVSGPVNGLGFYCLIEPNATIPLQARLSVEIDPVALQTQLDREVDPQRLTWAYWNGETWMHVNSQLDEDGLLVAETSHFSTWTVLEEAETQPTEPTEPTEPSEPETPQTMTYIIYGAAGLTILAVAYLYTRRAG